MGFDYLLFLLKSNCIILGFACFYALFLRKLTFFQANRFFLLSGLFAPVIYAMTDFSSLWAVTPAIGTQLAEVIPQAPRLLAGETHQNPVASVFINLYWGGFAIVGIRLILQIVSLMRLHQRGTHGQIGTYAVRILPEKLAPFSFGNTIYLNPSLYKPSDLSSILAHERTHVRQFHTFDILLSEVLVVFFWYNPAAWLLRKAIRENLEYLTDNSLIKQGFSKKNYQYSLLEISGADFLPLIVNRFNVSDLKRRIKMMNVRRSSAIGIGLYVLILPFLLLVSGFDAARNIKSDSLGGLPKKMAEVLSLSVPASFSGPPQEIKPEKSHFARSSSENRAKKTTTIETIRLVDKSPEKNVPAIEGLDFIPTNSRELQLSNGLQESVPKINLPGAEASQSSSIVTKKVIGIRLTEQSDQQTESVSPPNAAKGLQLDGKPGTLTNLQEVVVTGYPTKKSTKGQN